MDVDPGAPDPPGGVDDGRGERRLAFCGGVVLLASLVHGLLMEHDVFAYLGGLFGALFLVEAAGMRRDRLTAAPNARARRR